MIEHAIKANVPFVGVATDDLVYLETVLAHLAGRPCKRFTTTSEGKPTSTLGPMVYWTDKAEHATTDLFHLFRKNELTLVFVNSPAHLSVVDCGALDPPAKLVDAFLDKHIEEPSKEAVRRTLQGLSLRVMELVLALTSARCANLTVAELRITRASLMAHQPGLTQEDPSQVLYVADDDLAAFVKLNKSYFIDPKSLAALVPRGLLLTGPSGTGKTSAAKWIAKTWGVPLYRIDIAGMLDRYVGSGEKALKRALDLIDKEGPCILLLDEIEKVFAEQDDGGVTKRVMSILLWWLQEHRSRVFTVMTKNHGAIPEELCRDERVDLILELPKLPKSVAADLAVQYLMKFFPDVSQATANALFDWASERYKELGQAGVVASKARQWAIDYIKINGLDKPKPLTPYKVQA